MYPKGLSRKKKKKSIPKRESHILNVFKTNQDLHIMLIAGENISQVFRGGSRNAFCKMRIREKRSPLNEKVRLF